MHTTRNTSCKHLKVKRCLWSSWTQSIKLCVAMNTPSLGPEHSCSTVLARYKYQVWNRSAQALQPVTSRKQNSSEISVVHEREKKGRGWKRLLVRVFKPPQPSKTLVRWHRRETTGGLSKTVTGWGEWVTKPRSGSNWLARHPTWMPAVRRLHQVMNAAADIPSGTCGCTFPVFTQQKQEP